MKRNNGILANSEHFNFIGLTCSEWKKAMELKKKRENTWLGRLFKFLGI